MQLLLVGESLAARVAHLVVNVQIALIEYDDDDDVISSSLCTKVQPKK